MFMIIKFGICCFWPNFFVLIDDKLPCRPITIENNAVQIKVSKEVPKKPFQFNPIFVGAKTHGTKINPGHEIIIDDIVNNIVVNLLNEIPSSPKRPAPDNPPPEEETLKMPLDNQPENRSYGAITAEIDQLPQFSSANFHAIEPEKNVFCVPGLANKQQS